MTKPKINVQKTDRRTAFAAAAKAADVDTDEKRWEARLMAVAKPLKAVKRAK